MAVPTTPISESSPAGSDLMSTVDNRIREYKVQNREIMSVDHDYPSSGNSLTAGQHKKITLQEQADIGSGASGVCALGAQTVSGKPELVYTDEDDNDIPLTRLGTPVDTTFPDAKTSPVAADLVLLGDSADSYKSKKMTVSNLMNFIYPIGSVVTLGVSTNPNTLFGIGTWSAIAGRVVVGLDAGQTEFDALNETGGSKTVTLTAAQSGLPAHSHTYTAPQTGSPTYGGSGGYFGSANTSTTGPIDASEAHSNLQPYIVKYVWERIA